MSRNTGSVQLRSNNRPHGGGGGRGERSSGYNERSRGGERSERDKRGANGRGSNVELRPKTTENNWGSTVNLRPAKTEGKNGNGGKDGSWKSKLRSTITGSLNLADNTKAKFGDGGDLQIEPVLLPPINDAVNNVLFANVLLVLKSLPLKSIKF